MPLFFVLSLLLLGPTAFAATHDLPQDLVREVLSESVANAFEVFPAQAADFAPKWVGEPPAGVEVSVVPGSIQWVRISRFLVLPRARIRIKSSAGPLTVKAGGYAETLRGGGSLELPATLMSIQESPIELHAGARTHSFRMEYQGNLGARFFWDSSCSPYVPQVTGIETLLPSQWAYLGCRMVRSRVSGSDLPSLEVYLHWDAVQGPLRVGGTEIEPMVPGVWVFRLGPQRKELEVEAKGGQKLVIRLQVPAKLSYASLGMGIGPYSYYREDPGAAALELHPIPTFYGSYFLTEHSRMVFFDVYAPGERWYNDFGLYFNNESSRALDDRLSVNILLGFHIIGFKATSGVAYRFGVPQGFEMIFRDAFLPRFNASLGGFFYPPIAGKSYYNTWLRYGTSGLFVEVNYIAWSELGPADENVYTRTLGLTVGAPLLIFK